MRKLTLDLSAIFVRPLRDGRHARQWSDECGRESALAEEPVFYILLLSNPQHANEWLLYSHSISISFNFQSIEESILQHTEINLDMSGFIKIK